MAGPTQTALPDVTSDALAHVLSFAHVLDRAAAACSCRALRAAAALPAAWAALDLRESERLSDELERTTIQRDLGAVLRAKLWLRAGDALRELRIDLRAQLLPADALEIATALQISARVNAAVAADVVVVCTDPEGARDAERAARAMPANGSCKMSLHLVNQGATEFASAVADKPWPPALAEVTLAAAEPEEPEGEEEEEAAVDPDGTFRSVFGVAPAMKCPVAFVSEFSDELASESGGAIAEAVAGAVRAGARVSELDFHMCGIDDDHVETMLSAIEAAEPRALRAVRLSHNSFGDRALEAISSFVERSPTIREVRINRAYITDAGARRVARAVAASRSVVGLSLVPWKTYEVFYEGETPPCGDAGAAALADAVRSHASLEDLEYQNTDMTDEGVKLLALAVGENRSLRRVSVRDDRAFSPAAADAMRRANSARGANVFRELGDAA